MKRFVVTLIVCGVFFTSYGNVFSKSLGLVDEAEAAYATTQRFNSPAARDAAVAVFGIDGKVYSRMYDNKSDGYRVRDGQVWIYAKKGEQTDRGSTWGMYQSRSNIFIAEDKRWYGNKAGWSFCRFGRV